MSRRRKPTPQERYIYEQLDYIFHAFHALPEERDETGARAAWQKLWQETVAGEKLGTVDVFYAGWILSWGWRFAMEDGRYDEATDFMTAYFAHPDVETDDAHIKVMYRCYLATGLLFCGDEIAGVQIFRSLLACERKSLVRSALVHMHGDLTYYLDEPPGDEPAPPALADLVEEVVNRWRRRVPKRKRLPDNATYADLQRLLDSTYPPSGRAALEAERESKRERRVG